MEGSEIDNTKPGSTPAHSKFLESNTTKQRNWWVSPVKLLYRVDDALQPFRRALEHSALAHFIVVFAGLFTLYQLSVDLSDRREERQDRRDESFARALNQMTSPLESNAGRGATLNRLIRDGRSISELNLSCETISRWDAAKGECKWTPAFSGVDTSLRSDLENGEHVWLPQFHQVILRDSNLSRARISVDGDITIEDSDLSGSYLSGVNTQVRRSDLTGAAVVSHVVSYAYESNFSDAEILDGTYETHGNFPNRWFWADFPPRKREYRHSDSTKLAIGKLLVEAYGFSICDPRFRDEGAFISWPQLIGTQQPDSIFGARPKLIPDHHVPGSQYRMKGGKVERAEGAPSAIVSVVPYCPLLTYEEAEKLYPQTYSGPG